MNFDSARCFTIGTLYKLIDDYLSEHDFVSVLIIAKGRFMTKLCDSILSNFEKHNFFGPLYQRNDYRIRFEKCVLCFFGPNDERSTRGLSGDIILIFDQPSPRIMESVIIPCVEMNNVDLHYFLPCTRALKDIYQVCDHAKRIYQIDVFNEQIID